LKKVLQTATNGHPVIYLPLRLASIEIRYQTSGDQLAAVNTLLPETLCGSELARDSDIPVNPD
jgi:hypothetical protein